MKRVAAIGTVLLAGGLLLALTAFGGRGDRYRVDAIFDNASFLIPGQDVRIAGANAGSVVGVSVTPDNRARIEMSVDPRFGPFRSDADCFIAPQSLIGERFVQCTPGTPRGRVLTASGGRPATVPLESTHSPVDPDLVLDTYRLPYRQRLSIILNELGAGLSGNGQALSAAIRRANPALKATRDVLRIVDRDRHVLGDLIDRSDEVIAELGRRRGRVSSFVAEAARVAQTSGERQAAVSEGVRRLPATLHATRASLDALRVLAGRSLPLLADLGVSAEPLGRLVGDVPPLALAARPALAHLARMARVGTSTLREGAPVVRRLERFSVLAVPVGTLVRQLNESLRANGAVEGIQTYVTNIALSLARFDAHSHILPSYVVAPPDCSAYASITIPSCDAHFVSGPQTAAARRARRHRARVGLRAPRALSPAAARPAAGPPIAPAAGAVARRVLDYLLG
jgi:ABC-type transporter Mla subunit MlaD